MRLRTALAIVLLTSSACLQAAEFYVAPSGQPTGDGSINRPWDLQTALNHPATVKPGDTIWMRAGTYRKNNHMNKFVSYLRGAAGSPITLRAYPGERATIDGNLSQMTGGWAVYWGFEIYNSNTDRVSAELGPFPRDWWLTFDGVLSDYCVSGFDLQAPNCKAINLIVRDSVGGGFGVNLAAGNTEVYGCLSYYNGWQAPDRAHGHGCYTQNADPTAKIYRNNMFFENMGLGLQATGTGDFPCADNNTFDGNVFFMNGIMALNHQANFLTGSYALAGKANVITSNMVYDTEPSGSDSNIGYTGGLVNPVVRDNYFGTPVTFSRYLPGLVLTGNTFCQGTLNLTQSSYPNNTYSKPAGNMISVRPNQYEMGRANIVIYNWQKLNTVSVDVSRIGLNVGDTYELRNAADFFNDIIVGTYNGSPISIPMTGHTVAKPQGTNIPAPPTTFPEFGAFVIMKRTGGAVPPPVNTAPTITTIANQTIAQGTSTSPQSFTVGDAETVAGSLVVTASSSNPTLVPNANIVLGGTSASRTVTVTPVATQSGTATITLTVSDGAATSTSTFTVTVTAVNTPPTISAISARTIDQGTSTGPISFTVSDKETANLTVTGKSSNTALVPDSAIVLDGTGSSRTVSITPAPAQTGTAVITLTVSDGQATASTSFSLTVNAINTAPTISTVANQAINQDTSTAALGFTVGDKETPGSLVVTAKSSNQNLLPDSAVVLGGTGASRTVTATPVKGQTGTATVTLTVTDGSLTASSSFVLTVNAVTPPGSEPVRLGVEATSGTLVAPMSIATNSGAKYIRSATANQGTATYTINVPSSGTYVIWSKVLCPTYASDSFFVTMDGAEDVYDAAEGTQSANWQWTRVNGRRGTSTPAALNPRTFTLSAGQHTLVIRGREANAGLQRFVVTTDQTTAPKEVTVVNDAITAFPDVARQIDPSELLRNDTSLFGSALKVTSVGTAQNGTVALANGIITYTPKAGYVGSDSFSYTVTDAAGATASGTVAVTVQAAAKVHLGFEAESGTMTAPMTVATDAKAPARKYVWATSANNGAATYTISVPKAATYVIWCKVLCTGYTNDSFVVSVDGAQDIYDAAEGRQSANWQWTQLNGRNGTSTPLALNPRKFTLSAGQHTIVVRGREAWTGLDRVMITDDLEYVPKDLVAGNDTISAVANTATTISQATLLANDDSLFDDAIKISAVGTAQNGTVTLVNGVVTYTPRTGFVGQDTFTYTVSDDLGATATATVTVQVK